MSIAAERVRIVAQGGRLKDPLTAFIEEARQFIPALTPNAYCMTAVDIAPFSPSSQLHEPSPVEKLLGCIGDRLQCGGVWGRPEEGRFCIIMPWRMELVEKLLDGMRGEIEALGDTEGAVPLAGVCPIGDPSLPPELYYGRAVLALSHAAGRRQIVLYDPGMEEERNQHVRPAAQRGGPKRAWFDQCYGSLPCGYGIFRIPPGQAPETYEALYANRELERICMGDAGRLPLLLRQAFGGDMAALQRRVHEAAFSSGAFTFRAVSSISPRCYQFTLYQHCYGCLACLAQDVTPVQLRERALSSLANAYREIYSLQLQDNYYRKIHPGDGLTRDSGSYEEMVARRFGAGRILRCGGEDVGRFLSLDHLRQALAEEDCVVCRYRGSPEEGSGEWRMVSVTVSQRRNGTPVAAVLAIQSMGRAVNREEERLFHALNRDATDEVPPPPTGVRCQRHSIRTPFVSQKRYPFIPPLRWRPQCSSC